MKSFIVVCLFALIAVALSEKYTDKFDNIDVDEVISNDRLFDSYMKCILNEGKCTAEGKELKEHMQEAMETECAKCTDKQKEKFRPLIHHLIKNKNQYWKQMCGLYDVQNKSCKKYEDEVKH